MLALEGAARETSSAPSACLRERPYDVIADMDLRDVRTCCCNDPRDLMTQNRRRRRDIVIGEQEVRMTQARRLHVDENLAAFWRGDVHVFQFKPSTDRINYKCLHLCLLS
jgi:hypothetical protein